jgi:hypothetical protein
LGSTSFPWTSGTLVARHGANGSRQRSAVSGKCVDSLVAMMPTLRLRGVPATWPVPISSPATAGNQGMIVLCIFISHFSFLVTPQREYPGLSLGIGDHLSLRIGSSVSPGWGSWQRRRCGLCRVRSLAGWGCCPGGYDRGNRSLGGDVHLGPTVEARFRRPTAADGRALRGTNAFARSGPRGEDQGE